MAAGNYIGVLKPSATVLAIPDSALRLPFGGAFGVGAGAGNGIDSFQLRLGYRYSRNWSVEAGYSDSSWGGARSPFVGAGSGQRYGLGLKYDFTRSFGLKADMAHYSPFNRSGLREPDSDQLSLGIYWRF